jgi:cytosine/adenosine deaminase-related metal-dependent hydrolase
MSRTADKQWAIQGRWVFPGDGPPLADGVVRVAGERIVAVSTARTEHADLDLGNVAILPGLVNAHTHLDLGGMRDQAPPSKDFVGWLRRVIAHRRSVASEQIARAVETGLAECLDTGTTLVGDVAGGGASWPVLAKAACRSVVFYEVLGLSTERIHPASEAGAEWLRTHPRLPHCRPAVSPHAPYSTHRALFTEAAQLAQKYDAVLATHLAESREEFALLADRSGPFREFLEQLGVWNPDGLVSSPLDVLRICQGRCRSLVLVHCNYLPPETPFPPETTVIYCPRTHAAFGHSTHPFRELLSRGTRVALGTDSLASNPDLDILAEARFVHALYPDVSGSQLLRAITLSGAEALGWADECGSITPGKSADLAVLPLPDRESSDPYSLVFDSSERIAKSLWRGEWRTICSLPSEHADRS